MKNADNKSKEIKFGVTLLNADKIKNIFESSKINQNQTMNIFRSFEKKISCICDKITVNQIPFERILTLQLPDDFLSFQNTESSLTNARDKTPKMSQLNRGTNIIGLRSLLNSNLKKSKLNESILEKSRERKSSFLSRKHIEINLNLDNPTKENTDKMNRSFNRPKREYSNKIHNDFDPEIGSHLKTMNAISGETLKNKRPKTQSFIEMCNNDSQEENLLQCSNAKIEDPRREALKLNLDQFNSEAKENTNHFKADLSTLNNQRNDHFKSKSPLKSNIDLLKKIKSSDHIKIDLSDKTDTINVLKWKIETNLDTMRSEVGKKDKSRASSKNMSNININLDDFYERPSSRITEILKNQKNVKPPYVDFSSSSCLISACE